MDALLTILHTWEHEQFLITFSTVISEWCFLCLDENICMPIIRRFCSSTLTIHPTLVKHFAEDILKDEQSNWQRKVKFHENCKWYTYSHIS